MRPSDPAFNSSFRGAEGPLPKMTHFGGARSFGCSCIPRAAAECRYWGIMFNCASQSAQDSPQPNPEGGWMTTPIIFGADLHRSVAASELGWRVGGQNKGMNVTSICMRWLAVAPRGNYEEGP